MAPFDESNNNDGSSGGMMDLARLVDLSHKVMNSMREIYRLDVAHVKKPNLEKLLLDIEKATSQALRDPSIDKNSAINLAIHSGMDECVDLLVTSIENVKESFAALSKNKSYCHVCPDVYVDLYNDVIESLQKNIPEFTIELSNEEFENTMNDLGAKLSSINKLYKVYKFSQDQWKRAISTSWHIY